MSEPLTPEQRLRLAAEAHGLRAQAEYLERALGTEQAAAPLSAPAPVASSTEKPRVRRPVKPKMPTEEQLARAGVTSITEAAAARDLRRRGCK